MLASKYSILSVPYYFIFDNGQMKDSGPGGFQKHELQINMSPYLLGKCLTCTNPPASPCGLAWRAWSDPAIAGLWNAVYLI